MIYRIGTEIFNSLSFISYRLSVIFHHNWLKCFDDKDRIELIEAFERVINKLIENN